ncbi:MAG: membrane protein insertase YidC [bacterium]
MMEKRTILAVVLSTIVLLLWYRLFPPQQQAKAPVGEPAVVQAPVSTSVSALTEEPAQKQQVSREKEIIVDTGASEITLQTRGASVKSWKLKEDWEGDPVDLAVGKGPQLATFPDVIYSSETESLELTPSSPSGAVVFQHVTKEGIALIKTYSFSYGKSDAKITFDVHNKSENINNINLSLNWGPGVGTDKEIFDSSRRSMRGLLQSGGKLNKKPKKGDYSEQIEWVAIDNQYFMIALIPAQEGASVQIDKQDKLPVFLLKRQTELSPGGYQQFSVDIFAGTKETKVLEAKGKGLEKATDYGIFAGLSRLMLNILAFFYNLTGNYGVAIVLLTLIVQIPLFPLTAKSFKSMRAMQVLQPQMTELRKKYKDDPSRLNVEIMNLYKKNKVNPFGGCLPMLLQLPIFWALFTALRNAVELRHAPFIFWIQDLSRADGSGVNAAFRIAGEGLPFIGNSLNILALLMGGLMFLQQKMSSTDPSQAKMVVFMPVLFTVLFWNFPSGLVLYWIVNSIVTITGQYFIVKKH